MKRGMNQLAKRGILPVTQHTKTIPIAKPTIPPHVRDFSLTNSQIRKTDNSVHRRTDIMRHIGKKYALCLARFFRLGKRILKLYSLPEIMSGLQNIIQADVDAKQLSLQMESVNVTDEETSHKCFRRSPYTSQHCSTDSKAPDQDAVYRSKFPHL